MIEKRFLISFVPVSICTQPQSKMYFHFLLVESLVLLLEFMVILTQYSSIPEQHQREVGCEGGTGEPCDHNECTGHTYDPEWVTATQPGRQQPWGGERTA